MLWIVFTTFAAFMQSWRNALQKELRESLSTAAATLSRFLFAGPLAILYLGALYFSSPETPIPSFSSSFVTDILIAASSQILATALMVALFNQRNYAIGVGLSKSEALLAAILGVLFFATPLTWLAWLGVLVGSVAVWLLSKPSGNFSFQTLSLGLGSGLSFAICSLHVRSASIQLDLPFLHAAAWTLCLVLNLQAVALLAWIYIKEKRTLNDLIRYRKKIAVVSLFGFLGSVGWFTAMSLQHVPLVKTVGQIEIVFTLLISHWRFAEPLSRWDIVGLVLIMVGAVLVMLP